MTQLLRTLSYLLIISHCCRESLNVTYLICDRKQCDIDIEKMLVA